jgi:hypothetical protein
MIEIITSSVAMAYDTTMKEIKSSSRSKPLPEARRMIAFIMFKHQYKPVVIAQQIGKDRSLIGRAVDKLLDELNYYRDVKKKYAKTQIFMEGHLKNKIRNLENWLIENPEGEWQIRYDKIKELSNLKEELEELIIN